MSNNNLRIVLGMAAAVLGGCATPVDSGGGAAFTSTPTCQLTSTSCLVTVSVVAGSPPMFSANPDPAVTPSNVSNDVDIYWMLPAGYKFFAGDGVTLSPSLPFGSGFVTDASRVAAPPPNVGYHWTMNKGLAQVSAKYTIVFHQAGLTGPGQRWSCDPTISNFNSGFTPKSAPGGTMAAAPMTCRMIP